MDDHKIKIAIPSYNGEIMDHIGLCPFYMIYSVVMGNVIKEEIFTVPDDSLESENVAFVLAQKGVKILLAGKIEVDEIELLIFHGIKVYWNYAGNVNEVITTYLKSDLSNHELKEKGFCKTSNN